MTDQISWREFREAEGLEDWRNLADGSWAMFRASSFSNATRFVAAIGELPEVDGHPPSVDLRDDRVTVRLLTVTDTGRGMSRRDVELGRRISALARQHGLVSDPSAVQWLQIYAGVPGDAEVVPFWRAVLGYEGAPGNEDAGAVDPLGRGPSLWVEEMEEPRADGGGTMHVSVWVPIEVAEARVAAALAAGGRLVRDESPAWWTLADAAGNEADIATTMGRD